MLKQMLKQKWYVLFVVLFIFLDPMINSVLNLFLQNIFSAAQPGADKLTAIRLLTAGFLLWMLKRLVSFTSSLLSNRFICNTKYELKHRIFNRLFGLETSHLSQIGSSGDYITAFTTDITMIENRFYTQVVSFVSGIVSVCILGSTLFVLNIKLAAAILSFGMISMLIPLLFRKTLNDKSDAFSKSMSSFTTAIKDFVSGYATIKNNSAEQTILDKFDGYNMQSEESKFDSDYSLNVANSISSLMSWFMQFLAVGVGIMLVIKGEIPLATVLAAQAFASDLAAPFQQIISSWNSIGSVKSILHHIESISGEENVSLPEPPRAEVLQEFKDGFDIEFKDVRLELNGRKIINDFSFTFQKGKKYLIVGANGSGKSSVFKLLKRWFRVFKGEILLNGRSIRSLSTSELNAIIFYSDADVQLFSATVKDNLSVFRDNVDNDCLARAIEKARIDLEPNRFLDERNGNSTGQGAKIAVARSYLSDAGVVIFDETFANLDVETQHTFETAALEMEGRTLIHICHNLSGKLISQYDEIVVIGDGRIMDHGSYEALRKSCAWFNRLCEIKFG